MTCQRRIDLYVSGWTSLIVLCLCKLPFIDLDLRSCEPFRFLVSFRMIRLGTLTAVKRISGIRVYINVRIFCADKKFVMML
jgi:hypothetical protein